MRGGVFVGVAVLTLLLGLLFMFQKPLDGVTDGLRYLEVAALLATGIVVLWYTRETARLREYAEAQLAQSERPMITLRVEPNGVFRFINIGHGPALEVVPTFMPTASDDGVISGLCKTMWLPKVNVVRAGADDGEGAYLRSTGKDGQPTFWKQGDVGRRVSSYFGGYAPLLVEYTDITGRSYVSLIRVDRGIVFVGSRRAFDAERHRLEGEIAASRGGRGSQPEVG